MNTYEIAQGLAEELLPAFYAVPKFLDFSNPNQAAECGLTFENKRALQLSIMRTLDLADNDGGRNSILVLNAIAKAASNLFIMQFR